MKVTHFEGCPRCIAAGRDRHGDNLGVYVDGSAHCFSCSFHRFPRSFVRKVKHASENKAVLPDDFAREIPAAGWRWLLQFGLPYTYWLPFTGYSETHNRLIFTVGRPTRFSIGRYLGNDEGARTRADSTFRKWRVWGDRSSYVEVLGEEKGSALGREAPVVLVEDVISAHKVAQVATAIPLFGVKISDQVIKLLIALKRPVVLWLDADQYTLLAPKINRLQTFLGAPVRFVKTPNDPKTYSLEKIKKYLDI